MVLSLPSSSGVTNISRKGIEPSSQISSDVNWMLLLMEFRWSKKASLWFLLMTVKASSTNLDEHFPQTRRSHDRNLAKACLLAIYLFCFWENYPTYMLPNRMRNIHTHMKNIKLRNFIAREMLIRWLWLPNSDSVTLLDPTLCCY